FQRRSKQNQRQYRRVTKQRERELNAIFAVSSTPGEVAEKEDEGASDELDPEEYPAIEDEPPDKSRISPDLDPDALTKALEGCKLSPKWRLRLINLLWEFKDVFDSKTLGYCDIAPHDIDTGDAAPTCQRPFPVSIRTKAILETQIKDMLEKGVIRLSDSPWAAGLVVVTKADGTPRVCTDFRLLNSCTRGPDRFPLPKIDDMINKLRHAKFFTCLDLLSGFWQQALSPESIEKTAFVTQ
ncbi:MAG: RNA-directed DNA polymerase, partial [Gammaproteobacteria bacterium]|nr:RNA-directed DNA polymerase [Gammaproteobacteria bacterium]